jgi:hypothetical protein
VKLYTTIPLYEGQSVNGSPMDIKCKTRDIRLSYLNTYCTACFMRTVLKTNLCLLREWILQNSSSHHKTYPLILACTSNLISPTSILISFYYSCCQSILYCNDVLTICNMRMDNAAVTGCPLNLYSLWEDYFIPYREAFV